MLGVLGRACARAAACSSSLGGAAASPFAAAAATAAAAVTAAGGLSASAPATRLHLQRLQLQAGAGLRSAWTDSRGYTHFDNGGGGLRGLLTGRFAQAAAVTVVVGGGAYYYSRLEEVPYTHRRHAMLFVSKEREKALGRQMFDMHCQEAALTGKLLPAHHPYCQAVRRVGARVAAVAGLGGGGGVYEHMQNVQWEFAVINSPVPNAFVVPGGKVVVYTGLLELLGSEEELGAVLAHETGHVLARHHAERISSLNLWGIIKVLAWVLFGIGLPNAAFALGIFLPYSRLAEYEADAIGLQLMATACFDPKAATTMLQKLHAKESKQPMNAAVPAFMRTHPLTKERVQRVKDALPKAYETYQRSGCVAAAGFLDAVMGPGLDDGLVFER